MKLNAKLLVFLLGLAIFSTNQARGQDSERYGYIQFFNLVSAGEGNAMLAINGTVKRKKGYKLGKTSGPIGRPLGSLNIEVRKEGCKEGKLTVPVLPNITSYVIAYNEQVKNQKGEIIQIIKLVTLKYKETKEDESELTLISLCPEESINLTVQGRGMDKPKNISLLRKKITRIELGEDCYGLFVSQGDNPIPGAGFRLEEKGNYVVIFYKDKEGKLVARNYLDTNYMPAKISM